MKHTIVLDIGSSKVASICAGRVGEDGLAVYGANVREYPGYRFGKIIDVDALKRAIVESLRSTQAECGLRMRDVAVSIPSPFTKLYLGNGSITFDSKPKRITDADIDMLINNSLPQEPFEGFTLMHSTPYAYVVDGEAVERLQEDALAQTVKASVSHVYVSDEFMEPVQEAVREFGVCSMCTSSLLGEALLLIPEQARNSRAVLLDVGYTHTDLCLMDHSALIAQKTIEVGGLHIMRDVAQVLDISDTMAEEIKRRYVFGLDYQDSIELLRTPEGTKSAERTLIQDIIEERAYELCALIHEAMQEIGAYEVNGEPQVYIAGGGIAHTRGSREFMERALGFRIKREMPWMPRLNSPNYASAFGAMEFVLEMDEGSAVVQMQQSGVMRRIRELFSK
ncbi:hypothetical protein LJC42_07065 [Eubacteriales bacterium OttesenSCG-928-K08]|nr:hypothetical protein [Eubacteriales bacterium OttesenSCG-928-K08]